VPEATNTRLAHEQGQIYQVGFDRLKPTLYFEQETIKKYASTIVDDGKGQIIVSEGSK
jgi:hypothetical protein